MEIEQTFRVGRPPEDVFAFMVDPGNLARWQTIKTHVEPLTEGPPRVGYRLREGNKVGLRTWDQVVEFTEFEPGRAFTVKVVEGPESSGRWQLSLDPDGGSRVDFVATFKAPQVLAPLMRRQFRKYHEHLRHELDAGGW